MFCLKPQNAAQFPISLLQCSQISFLRTFFWGLQTASSCWGPDLEKRVGAEAIQSAIHLVLSSLRSTRESVLSWWKCSFSSSFAAIFWQFLPSIAPVMLYDINYWWFFLSQGNQWTKYLAPPKIWRLKPCLPMFASGRFGQLSPAVVHSTADLTPEWSGRSRFHPLSRLRKNSFLLHWNSCKQRSESSTCCFW